MSDAESVPEGDALAQARATIARQAEEIERLRRRAADERWAEEMRDALQVAATTGAIAAPVTHHRLLEMIVQTAAQVITARAAALFLIDEERQELVFEVALGHKAAEAKKFRVPLGHGIAGLVAVTGQPMAISEAHKDSRQASDIARSIGYIPQNILCVPLFYDDQIIGVLELLDRVGAASFTTADIMTLGLFANLAAVAIEQSRVHQNLGSLIAELPGRLGSVPEHQRQHLAAGAQAFAATVEQDEDYARTLELARLVQMIAREGPDEIAACRTILQGFADYLRARGPQAGRVESRP